ncbi:MAG: hypothetical protein KF745_04550 [Phycisphaeraceae bacterium]|nr:hypothetical protein [Phycisphaeraceae bacterium]
MTTSHSPARPKPFRVLQVGMGPLGKMIVADLQDRRVGRVVAAVDASPEIAGKHLAEVVPGSDADVVIRKSVGEVKEVHSGVRSGIDCAIVTTASDLPSCKPLFLELLARGISVVSTCEELLFPWLRHDAMAREIDTVAHDNGARILGTGVNPGFLMDTLPVFASAVCRSVSNVTVYRVQDATSRRVPFQQKIGAGLTDDEFVRRVRAGTLRHVGLGESLHFIARYFDFRLERWDEKIGPVHADRDLTCALGEVPKGRVSGVKQVAHGWDIEDNCVISLHFQAAIGQQDPHDRVVIEGEPRLDLRVNGGVHGDIATSAIVVNCIAPLLEARPGLQTMATIPLVKWTAERM